MLEHPIPYCGRPPVPDTLWLHGNFDPGLIAIAACILLAYAYGVRRRPHAGRHEYCFAAGWTIALIALISPLCPLSVALFSARVGQHMILILIAAPLLVQGRPLGLLPRSKPWARIVDLLQNTPFTAATLFAICLWFWHAPTPYQATFLNPVVYWLMHLSLLGSASYLWCTLLQCSRHNILRAIIAGTFTTMQMGFLGALITFTPDPLYAEHALTTYAWGLSPLQDQQLGGVLMWIPGCSVLLVAAIRNLARLMAAPYLRQSPHWR